MRAINIFKLPLNDKTKKELNKCLDKNYIESDGFKYDLSVVLTEELCDLSKFMHVGRDVTTPKRKKKENVLSYYERIAKTGNWFVCWPDFNDKCIKDLYDTLTFSNWLTKEATIKDLEALVEDADMVDFWK